MHDGSSSIARIRRLATPTLVLAIVSRFVFGVGVEAALAGRPGGCWRRFGWFAMLLGTLLLAPAAAEVREKDE